MQEFAEELVISVTRIAGFVRRIELRRKLEDISFSLLEAIIAKDFAIALIKVETLRGFINLAKYLYEIEIMNADFLIKESGKLKERIENDFKFKEFKKKVKDVTFPNNPAIERVKKSGNEIEELSKEEEKNNPAIESGNEENDPEIRQSSIIEKIKQFGNRPIQIRDFLIEFPDKSERTLRYDLQKLCNQGTIEKIGNGPSTYYRLPLPDSSVIS